MANPPPTETSGFSARAALIAIALSLFLLMSTSYVALKLGAAPWPIIFSVIMSGGLLKLLNRGRRVNIHEVNAAQAGASVGGLVAAGIVFTLPGILYLNQSRDLTLAWPDPWLLGLLTATAGLLGIVLSLPLKRTFIDQEQLPYPAGTAGAELLRLGKTGGRPLFAILIVGAATGIFTLFRDTFFPAGITLSFLTQWGIVLTLLPWPIAIGAGYILGAPASFSWLSGAVIGWLILIPVLFQQGLDLDSATSLAQNLGMGMVLGAGIGFFVSYVLPRLKKIFGPLFNRAMRFFPVLLVVSVLTLVWMQVPWLAAVFAVIGVWITVAVAARMTGETNIDPLEQFGIFIGLMIALIYGLASWDISMSALFLIVTFVSVACAIAGDVGHDYKSAALLGTRFMDIVKIDIITVVVSGLAAPFVLDLIRRGFQDVLFTPVMPAPQAQLVAGSIFGFDYPLAFALGFAIAFLGEFGQRFLPDRLRHKLLLMPMGIGLFLGPGLALPIALGAVIRVYVDRHLAHVYYTGLLIAAGAMGGEGIAGFGAGALTLVGLTQTRSALVLSAGLSLLLLFSIWKSLVLRSTQED